MDIIQKNIDKFKIVLSNKNNIIIYLIITLLIYRLLSTFINLSQLIIIFIIVVFILNYNKTDDDLILDKNNQIINDIANENIDLNKYNNIIKKLLDITNNKKTLIKTSKSLIKAINLLYIDDKKNSNYNYQKILDIQKELIIIIQSIFYKHKSIQDDNNINNIINEFKTVLKEINNNIEIYIDNNYHRTIYNKHPKPIDNDDKFML